MEKKIHVLCAVVNLEDGKGSQPGWDRVVGGPLSSVTFVSKAGWTLDSLLMWKASPGVRKLVLSLES